MYGKRVLFSPHVVTLSIRCKTSSSSTKKLLDVLANMPKANSARISEAQRQRQNISKKCEKYAPSTVYLQVLGSGARGAPNTLYVFTDQKRYLFNCGESTQRLAHEHKVKLSKLEHIFITSKTWTNIGGLPGLSLTLQDVGVPKLTLHGPEGLDELYQATKRFVIMKDMNVSMAACSPAEDFEDNVMSVKYVLLGAHEGLLDGKPATKKPKLSPEAQAHKAQETKELEKFIHDDTDYYTNTTRQQPKPAATKKHWDNSRPGPHPQQKDVGKAKTEKALHDLTKKKNCTVAFICTLKKRLGTLDLAKCVELGVPPGPMLGQLKAGFDVVLSNGKLVLSKDVKTPDDPGPVFIVLEVPELSYLKETEFSAHFDTPSNQPERIPSLVVHYTPPHVLREPKYREFMAMFGKECKHLVLNSQNSCLGSEAVHRTQHKLHLLDPDIFPLLRDASIPAVWNTSSLQTESPTKIKGLEELKNKIALAQFQNIINMEGSCKGDAVVAEDEEKDRLRIYEGRSLSIFNLRPKNDVDRSLEPKLHIQDYIRETMDIDGFVSSLEAFRKQVDSIRYLQNDAKEFPKIVFLGTGSCIPSKTRNTSGMVLQVNENKSILLDCGEGTFGQLVRFFGPKRVNSFLRTVRAIYISHLHADHHIGLINVLQARRQAFKEHPSHDNIAPYEPVLLLAPGQIMSWLTIYDQQFERIHNDFTLVPNQKLLYTEHSQTELTATLASIGVQQIKTCQVSHCPNAFGVAIEVDGDHKITYSGDTIPCEELVVIGERSTLLIHEATMEDELAEEARVKMHSTTSQAIEQGRLMRAQYTVLTHFSQRYARLPRLNKQILLRNQSVGIAFDNMQIAMSDLKLLPSIYAPLQLMFAEHCVEMELKAAHRARMRERRDSEPSLAGDHRHHKRRERRDRSVSRHSSGVRAVESAPRPSANYRESTASRMRQEMKGMTVTGVVRGPRGSTTQPAPRSYSRTSSVHSDNSGAHLDSSTPYDTQSLRSEEISCTPRSISNTSNRRSCRSNSSSKSNIGPISKKSIPRPSSSDVVNLMTNVSGANSLNHYSSPGSSASSTRGRSPVMSQLNKKLKVMRYAPDTNCQIGKPQSPPESLMDTSGYGKPLVTNMNKRLKIMRYTPTPILFDQKEIAKMKQCPKTRSPVRSMKSNYKEASSLFKNAESKAKILKNRIELLTQLLFHFMAFHTAYFAFLVTVALPFPLLLITAAVLFWTATKNTISGNKLRPSLTNPSIRPERKYTESRPESARLATRPSSLTRSNNSPSSSRKSPMEFAVSIRDSKIPVLAKPRSPERRQITAKEAPRKTFEPLQDIVTERLKQPMCKGKLVPVLGRPHSGVYNSKTYKPQLEDIKSSFLLLNKQTREQNKKLAAIENVKKPEPGPAKKLLSFDDNKSKQLMEVKKKFQSRGFYADSFLPVTKPEPEPQRKPLSFEYKRRKELMEVKKKFQSKGFFADSKYDKIEGLNWISWK